MLRLGGVSVSVLTAGLRVTVKVEISGSAALLTESVAVIVAKTVTGADGGFPAGAVRTTAIVTSAPSG
jgi:hypothetical protein